MYWWVNVCEIAPLPRKSAKSRPHQNFRTSATFSPSKHTVNPCKITVISQGYSAHCELYFNVLIVLIDPFFVEFRAKGILGGSSRRSSPEVGIYGRPFQISTGLINHVFNRFKA